VTKPFGFEGSHRARVAETAAAELAKQVDALIVVPNDRVGGVLADDASMIDAFRAVDDVLLHAVQGIIDLIAAPGLINLDFADIRSVMQDAGPALVGLGRGSGQDRALDAAREAIASPLLEASIEGARGILFSISGPSDLRLREVQLAAEEIRTRADVNANVIFGASFSDSLAGDVVVTLIATGLNPGTRTTPSPVEDSSGVVTTPIPESRRSPRRPARTVPEASPAVAAVAPLDSSDEGPGPSSTLDDADLEVPSFLRRTSRRSGRT
jgi:cell division protein FtsZ